MNVLRMADKQAAVAAFAGVAALLLFGAAAGSSEPSWLATDPPGESWKSVDPDMIGNVAPLLLSAQVQHPTAQKKIPLDANALKAPIAFAILDALNLVAVLEARDGAFELRTMALDTGAVSEPVAKIAGADRSFQLSSGLDGISVVVQPARGKPIEVYDLKTRTRRASITTAGESGGYSKFFVADASTLVATTGDGKIQRWDLATGASKGTAPIKAELNGGRFVPVACAGGTLVIGLPPSPGAAANAPITLLAVDIVSGEVKAKKEVPSGPFSWSDGCDSLVLGSSAGGGWKDLRVIKVASLESGQAQTMTPEISSVQSKLARGGDLLLMLEYMVNVIVVWDTTSGKPIATMPAEVGGSASFQVSRDGATLVSLSGPFVEGGIRPDHWEIYDLRAIQSKPASTPSAK